MSSVSVVIPVFNRAEWTLRAVKSVLLQTWTDFELIVVDDGSHSDMSAVRLAVEQSGGYWIASNNRGAAAARNLGVLHASGKWIAFLDSDDEWKSEKLERQCGIMSADPSCRICHTDEIWFRHGRFVNQRNTHRKPDGEAFFRSLELCCISPSSVMLERALFEEYGGFDELLPVCEDYDLWLRITAGEPVALISEPLVVKHGGHADQLSRSRPAIDRYRVYALCKLFCSGRLLPAQERALLAELQKKNGVLAQGAQKRRNAVLAELCCRMGRELEAAGAGKPDKRSLGALMLHFLRDPLSAVEGDFPVESL